MQFNKLSKVTGQDVLGARARGTNRKRRRGNCRQPFKWPARIAEQDREREMYDDTICSSGSKSKEKSRALPVALYTRVYTARYRLLYNNIHTPVLPRLMNTRPKKYYLAQCPGGPGNSPL